METKFSKKIKVIVIISFLIGATLISNVVAISDTKIQTLNTYKELEKLSGQETEYWALLVAVGVYADSPQSDRPLMLEEVDDLYDTLIQSGVWSEDHIKVIKGKDATCINIVSGLKWLDEKEDEDDFSVVFITTHGFPLDFDFPPYDEEDNKDEALTSYWGFAYGSLFIYDDQLNYYLNQLESKGVCLIVDSCYAGGFNDPPNLFNFRSTNNKISTEKWIEEFGGELSGQNRVVLMASREDEVSYSGGFAPYLIDGLRGYADINEDEVVTAEEAFIYCEPRCSRQTPTIYDGYPGELPLIYLSESKQSDYNADIGSSPENSVIKGFVKDADSNDPIENAIVYIRGREDGWEFFENYTVTDPFGFYSFNVPASRCGITVTADGYCSGQSNFIEINENEILWINFSLYPRPPENSIICGYIKDNETDDPINGANISLYWQEEFDQFYLNETNSDHNGFYSMDVAAGEIDLEVEAVGYFRDNLRDIIISDYEIVWANFSLRSPPPENSVVCGYVLEKDSGEPMNNIEIEFEWIDIETDISYQNSTHTNTEGFYSINIAPGEVYHDIRNHDYYYYNPYRINSVENETTWHNITIEEETIEVEIVKPLKALYINNNRIIPYIKTRIIGSIDIEASINGGFWGPGSADRVEFYIDGDLMQTLTDEPYILNWSDIKFGKHTIKVIAYDYEGNSDFDEIVVYKFI